AAASFEARRIAGTDFVALDGDSGPLVVCPGELVASIADVAIVVRGEMLVACRYAGVQAEVVRP
ncbi:MAG TPA: hypothetical protein VFD39_14910, partial [Trueperaceae bacterium]|nr:hypothetical protein [Trueperaceae bacterium]